ncbi:MAG: FUSC family protein [Aquabacterium sp.]|uniref:FUSC family protein n=1 Tax=Aquabacterium sp. TaxID=1872578 RepID=UPI002723B9D6|nr:FUSC family protein [Aquabacterium sp.]MDO9004211.1 FUSC family protein [Aquabacterium sp.]
MIPTRAMPFPWRLPAPLLNGASVGVGLAVITAVVASIGGMPAAVAASSGAAAASVADTVSTPRAKTSQMVPAVMGSVLVAALVALTHANLLALTLCVLAVSFTSVMWNAWGKRGGPQTFAMVLSLIFQMAAYTSHPMDAGATWQHLGWVTTGALSLAVWSHLSAMMLAGRYRTLALVDSLRALSQLMRTQAAWTTSLLPEAQAAQPAPSLLPMVRQQAAIADVFQSARDLLYSQAAKAPKGSRTLRLTSALFHIVNLRDVVLACQLDLDSLPLDAHAQRGLQTLAQTLVHQADQLDAIALALRNNTRLPEPVPLPARPWPEHDARLISLGRRTRHMVQIGEDIANSLVKTSQPLPMNPAVLLTLVSPNDWTLAPLRDQLNWQSPVLRHALRATLAMGCADALAHWLPWTSHSHWLLMTVAVVMRGNLEQTLARRDARILGTLVGCVLASALLWLNPGAAWLFAVLALSLSLAHGYVQRDYRITAASGALLALLQAHLFTPSHHPALFVAGERLADTLIGAGLAWAFSYVLPSWEQGRLPALVRRLLTAQARYAHHVLRWHQTHAQSTQRSHARREVYDVLWLLAQALERMKKEPKRVRSGGIELETVLIRSHRLISHLAGIKGLLTMRQSDLDPALIQPALQHTEQALVSLLTQPVEADATASPPSSDTNADIILALPAANAAPGPWLLHRLAQTVDEAQALAHAAQAVAQQPRP